MRNRRTAPDLYLGVKTINRDGVGSLEFDGEGELVDAVVEMVRFDSDQLFDRLADESQLTSTLMKQTVDMISRFHSSLSPVNSMLGSKAIENVLSVNERGFAIGHIFDPEEINNLNQVFRSRFLNIANQLDKRGAEGKIVLGHGDLHLRNLCLFNNRPTLFDCIEFNDTIATVDTLYDLSFLLMDLWHRNLVDIANMTANRYIDISEDSDGFCLLPYFMALRAAVRAHVIATQVEESGKSDPKLSDYGRTYFDLAQALLQQTEPHLIAIGGLSGTGKSTIAEALAPKLAPAPGARILESDRIRKQLRS